MWTVISGKAAGNGRSAGRSATGNRAVVHGALRRMRSSATRDSALGHRHRVDGRPRTSPPPPRRLATSVCRLRHESDGGGSYRATHKTQHVPTEFWWCGGRVLLSGL